MPKPSSRPGFERLPAALMLIARTAVLSFASAGLLAAAAVAAETSESSAASIVSDLGLRVAADPVRERAGWKPPRKILLSPLMHDDLPALQQVAPAVQFIEVSATTPASAIADADAAMGVCDEKTLRAAPQLQWIQLITAGVEQCVRQPYIRERQPLVTNLQRVAAAPMAEHVLAMMLFLSRHFDYFLAQQQRGHWSRSDRFPQPIDLKGKTLLVAGLGGIGTEVARRAYAFGMRITATRASAAAGPDFVSYVGSPEELLKLARDADFIVNCTPLTPQTSGMFNKQFFGVMKPSAYFFNVGRGGSVVTADLIDALRAGRIAGAGLDVIDPEPLPASSPLWHLRNVIITPHISAFTPVANDMRLAVLQENLRRYDAGEPMLSVVDIERGY